jgi:hypothetical protein
MTTRAVLAGFALLVLAGCGVTSDHPLSDEKTSVVDEDLIGRWRAVKAGTGKETSAVFVGRVKGTKNTLEAVGLELDDEQHVRVQRFRLYATTIGDRRYLSATGEMTGPYMFLRYAKPDEDTLHLYLMEAEFVARAIEAGELEGTVERKKSEGDVRVAYETVHVTADTAKLRAWILKHQDECFAVEDPTAFERVEPTGDGASR